MWLEAIFTQDDLQDALSQFAPVTIALGESGGELALDKPTHVELVDGRGLRVDWSAVVRWPVLGFNVPVTIDALRVILEPEIVQTHDGDTLVFGIQLEAADVKLLPAILDEKVVSRINEELRRRKTELSWNFTKTLTNTIPLPKIFAPRTTLELRVLGGKVKTQDSLVGLAVAFQAKLLRSEPGEPDAAGTA